MLTHSAVKLPVPQVRFDMGTGWRSSLTKGLSGRVVPSGIDTRPSGCVTCAVDAVVGGSGLEGTVDTGHLCFGGTDGERCAWVRHWARAGGGKVGPVMSESGQTTAYLRTSPGSR
ncbi:hypothetical protein GCM10027590_50830 [Nocardiopsis nanhaiensis]